MEKRSLLIFLLTSYIRKVHFFGYGRMQEAKGHSPPKRQCYLKQKEHFGTFHITKTIKILKKSSSGSVPVLGLPYEGLAYLGDKSRSPAKPSHCMDKRCWDLKNIFCWNRKLHFQLNVSEFESNSESESGGIFVNLRSCQTFITQRMETATAT